MLIKIIKTIIFLISFFFVFLSSSQDLPIRVYYTDDGLASSQVWSIEEDGKGYVWFGCSSGTSRFNGFEFKNFRLKEGLPNESIRKIVAFKKGSIVALTVKGIAYFEPEKNRFIQLPYIGEASDIAVTKSFREKKKGKLRGAEIFVVIKNKGIFRFNFQQKRWDYVGFKSLNPSTLQFFKGKLYFACEDGKVFRCSLENKNKLDFLAKVSPITKIKVSKKTLIFVSSHNIYSLIKDNRLKPIFSLKEQAEIIFDATFDFSHNLWVATNQGLRKVGKKKNILYTAKNGLPSTRVLSVFYSDEGILWFGTNHGACKLISEDMLVFKDKYHSGSLSYICFYYERGKKQMMVGCSAGVLIFKGDKVFPLKSTYLSKFPVWAIKKFNGKFYFATEGGGVVERDKNGKERHFRFENGYLPGNNATDLYVLGDCLYVSLKEGFAYLRDGKWVKFNTSNGLPVSYVRCLEVDNKGNLLLGTLGAGIVVYKDGVFSNYIENIPEEGKSVFDLYFDRTKNTLWVATNYGLLKIKNKKIKFYSQKHGFLPFGLSVIYPVKNYLWIGSDGGAQLFDPVKESVVKILTRDDGLPGNEFTTHNAIYSDPANNVWFGLFGGIARIEKLGIDLKQKREFRPRVFPTQVSYYLNNKTIFKRRFLKNEITLPYGAKEVFINFDVIWYRNEYSLKIEYKLKGINTKWNKINDFKNMKIYYTSLPPGKYPLYVKVSSINGRRNVVKNVLTIFVPAPFWQNIWFILGVMIIFLSMIIFIIKMVIHYRTQRLKKEAERLNALVEEKTQELKKLTEKFKNLSEHDYLTGLYNRRYFIRRVFEFLQRISDRDPAPGACFILFDIDFFKRINDTFGHDAGDFILKSFADLLNNSIRKSDFGVRYGGEEFLVLIRNLKVEDAEKIGFSVAEKIRKKVEESVFEYNGKEIKITVSGGVSCFNFKDFSKEKLEEKLKEVDEKLYEAKKSGRNRVVK